MHVDLAAYLCIATSRPLVFVTCPLDARVNAAQRHQPPELDRRNPFVRFEDGRHGSRASHPSVTKDTKARKKRIYLRTAAIGTVSETSLQGETSTYLGTGNCKPPRERGSTDHRSLWVMHSEHRRSGWVRSPQVGNIPDTYRGYTLCTSVYAEACKTP